jgi:hypothetical protein
LQSNLDGASGDGDLEAQGEEGADGNDDSQRGSKRQKLKDMMKGRPEKKIHKLPILSDDEGHQGDDGKDAESGFTRSWGSSMTR